MCPSLFLISNLFYRKFPQMYSLFAFLTPPLQKVQIPVRGSPSFLLHFRGSCPCPDRTAASQQERSFPCGLPIESRLGTLRAGRRVDRLCSLGDGRGCQPRNNRGAGEASNRGLLCLHPDAYVQGLDFPICKKVLSTSAGVPVLRQCQFRSRAQKKPASRRTPAFSA